MPPERRDRLCVPETAEKEERKDRIMTHLTKAHEQLFRRAPDERFSSLSKLWEHCHREKQDSLTRWYAPVDIKTEPDNGQTAGA